jgi:inosine-uridine nucleoside N-ribohydrolase
MTPFQPRYRVISDNDYGGDPDGLFQLAHMLLSPSLDVRAVIGSHLAASDVFDRSDTQVDNAVERVQAMLELLDKRGAIAVHGGAETGLTDTATPNPSAGAEAIVSEAMRTDTDLPLFVTVGGGLTELASAYLLEPGIADRLTAVWIGGPEYPELGPHPERPGAGPGPEYNLNIDLRAAQVVFNESSIPLWQVPRNAYRQALVSMSELDVRLRRCGAVGEHLYDALLRVFETDTRGLGETYILGDNPLVLLTALLSQFEPASSSSAYAVIRAPWIDEDGAYQPRSDGRPIRVYTRLDVRLMTEDLYAKLAEEGRCSTP